MRVTYLKIKIKSLAAEASIIRHEEQQCYDHGPGSLWFGLNYHRRVEVRKEARAACLAYGFLRGRAFKQIECSSHTAPEWGRVVALVRKYGPLGAHEQVKAWWQKPEPAQKAAA